MCLKKIGLAALLSFCSASAFASHGSAVFDRDGLPIPMNDPDLAKKADWRPANQEALSKVPFVQVRFYTTGFCSASVIALDSQPLSPTWIITAGHCALGTDAITSGQTHIDYPLQGEYYVSKPDGSGAKNWIFDEKAVVTDSVLDLAIFKSGATVQEMREIGIEPLKLAEAGSLKEGEKISVLGSTFRLSWIPHQSDCQVAKLMGGRMNHHCSTEAGFSGGPVFRILPSGQTELVGINREVYYGSVATVLTGLRSCFPSPDRISIPEKGCPIDAGEPAGTDLSKTYRKLCDRGDLYGCFKLSLSLRQKEDRWSIMKQACMAGHEQSCMYYTTWVFAEKDAPLTLLEEAIQILESGCSAGQLMLCAQIGEQLTYSDDPTHQEQGWKYIAEACTKAGLEGACASMALHLKASPALDPDGSSSARYRDLACGFGDYRSCTRLKTVL